MAEARTCARSAQSHAPAVGDTQLSLGELVEALQNELGKQHAAAIRDVEAVTQLMQSYDATRNEWKRYALLDESHSYTRNLVATDNQHFTLMLLCWNPAKASPVHAHAASECWLRVVSGVAQEDLFSVVDEKSELRLVKSSEVGPGSVCYIDDSIGLHSIANAGSEEPMFSLHCYSPPFDSCKVFFEGTGHGVDCDVIFYSEHGVVSDLHAGNVRSHIST